jgi:repressor LexA
MVTILLPQTKRSAPLRPDNIEHDLVESFESIAIVGWVSCGQPIDMFTQDDTINVPSKLVRKNTYALRVRGDSMRDANILDGDVVVIEQSQMAESGEKVVVRINQKEVTLKTLRLDQDGVKLIPANRSMDPIVLNNADVEVLGIIRGVIRDRI